MSFITHPDYLIEDRARTVYQDLLVRLSRERDQGGLWVAPPSGVNDWWRARHEMALVQAGDSWRIEGASSEKARVAYAVLRDGRCAYTLDESDAMSRCPLTVESVARPQAVV